jgi:hypothetical protein
VKIKTGQWYKLVEDHHPKAVFAGIYSYWKATEATKSSASFDVYDFAQGVSRIDWEFITPQNHYHFREASEAEVSESIAWIAERMLLGKVRL